MSDSVRAELEARAMTTRVFECEREPLDLRVRRAAERREAPAPRLTAAVFAGVLVALLVVPVAGAAEPPYGWPVAGATALVLLIIAACIGQHLPWGVLALLAAGAGLAVPRGPYGVIGPALLVATVICTVLWLGTRGSRRRRNARDNASGPRERAAQVMMGVSGERRAGHVLAGQLPQDYVLINGLKLPRTAGDIDHLVIGPTGLFLLETKTMAGQIACQPDGTWRRTRVGRGGTPYVAFIGDPAAQVQRNIFTVRECLRNRVPYLFRGTAVWIEGLVVFAHPQTQLDARHSRVPAVLLDDAASRICLHTPRRSLQPAEVDAVAQALLAEANAQPGMVIRQSAQAVVEIALMLPLVLAIVFGTVALSRAVQAQTAVVTLAHEAARAGALGRNPRDAVDRMRQRVALVAPGVGLDANKAVIDWDLSQFGQDPGSVSVSVRYPLEYGDLPLSGWIPLSTVSAEHTEWIDPFRSGMSNESDAP